MYADPRRVACAGRSDSWPPGKFVRRGEENPSAGPARSSTLRVAAASKQAHVPIGPGPALAARVHSRHTAMAEVAARKVAVPAVLDRRGRERPIHSEKRLVTTGRRWCDGRSIPAHVHYKPRAPGGLARGHRAPDQKVARPHQRPSSETMAATTYVVQRLGSLRGQEEPGPCGGAGR